MSTITFTGCTHLDFKPNYLATRQQTSKGLFWLRSTSPQMVQFCKKRGRVYGCEACLSKAEARCGDYEEVTHVVEVSLEELTLEL